MLRLLKWLFVLGFMAAAGLAWAAWQYSRTPLPLP